MHHRKSVVIFKWGISKNGCYNMDGTENLWTGEGDDFTTHNPFLALKGWYILQDGGRKIHAPLNVISLLTINKSVDKYKA